MNLKQFSNNKESREIIDAIKKISMDMGEVSIMEVCGTHTMEIGRLGLRQILPDNIKLISGPGCPVCVTPGSYIDALYDLSLNTEHQVRIITFGDMINVPGNKHSLAQAKASGAKIDVAVTPLQAIDAAQSESDIINIFTSVGFETTVPATAFTVKKAYDSGINNLYFLTAHRVVPPVLKTLITDKDINISGFLLPGHVSAIIGEDAYDILNEYKVPGVIAGFEPLDILSSILCLLNIIRNKEENKLFNMYTRVVNKEGNRQAIDLINEVYERSDSLLRGIGIIPLSGLKLREKYKKYDAALRFSLNTEIPGMPDGCSCGEVLKGIISPDKCSLFGKKCTPEHPVGPCMVSTEGSCAAYYKYG
jgi:hydrogenase expression/formation protein HypD